MDPNAEKSYCGVPFCLRSRPSQGKQRGRQAAIGKSEVRDVAIEGLWVLRTGTGWPDVIVATIMAGLALQGA